VLFVDVDRLREVNDRGGHAVGDQPLVRLADRPRRRVEKELLGAMMGRLGGDELVAVLPGVDASTAEAIGHGLTAILVDEVEVGRRTVRVSASSGLAMASPGTTLDEVLSRADRAMCGPRSAAAASCTWSGQAASRRRGGEGGLQGSCLLSPASSGEGWPRVASKSLR
jgi:diguanylate cyclase (GGDEF)-like protein